MFSVQRNFLTAGRRVQSECGSPDEFRRQSQDLEKPRYLEFSDKRQRRVLERKGLLREKVPEIYNRGPQVILHKQAASCALPRCEHGAQPTKKNIPEDRARAIKTRNSLLSG